MPLAAARREPFLPASLALLAAGAGLLAYGLTATDREAGGEFAEAGWEVAAIGVALLLVRALLRRRARAR